MKAEYVDCFGGPDAALDSFSDIQKAINFTMTSFLTTGGIRGGSEKVTQFQPRSFNMGLSKKAFEASNGFGNIHPGEDPDLSIRLWNLGFKTKLIKDAFVYHKRRISWDKFQIQVLDDSTDETKEIIANKVKELVAKGIDIIHIHRTDRTGYKAGALDSAMDKVSGEFIAIFDADFVPDTDFLLKTIPYFQDEKINKLF